MHDRCRECVIENAAKICAVAGVDEAGQRAAKERARTVIAHVPSDDDLSRAPYAMGEIWADLIETVGPDPYADLKATYEALTASMRPAIEEAVASADEPLPLALRFAASGNLIDVGTPLGFSEDAVADLLRSVPALSFSADDSASLIEAASKARTLAYLADNCGEASLDLVLIEALKRQNPDLEVTYVVRSRPILNDLLREDALAAGIGSVARVMDNGDAGYGAGTLLDGELSPEFRRLVEEADVVLAKGQGNFETLYRRLHGRLWFLFMAKCEAVADLVGVPYGSMLCLKNPLA